ncbi:3-isopropylmalate dehydratase small subunit [Paraburkholderia phymatum]|uniref:3-isopropylmalate dehydratase small subunit n=1 Tax=Paraburkholderia phymatum TaxID=148447 RepID=UPI00316F81F2
MEPFVRLQSVAAALPDQNIDTDIIYPGRFLTVTSASGLGRYALHDWRFDDQGREVESFVLNKSQWKMAQILVVGSNFGCGSSREHAVWSLADIGIRCVVSTSFGEIFQGNCYKNGVLPLVVDQETYAVLVNDALEARMLDIDLQTLTIKRQRGEVLSFELSEARRLALVNGWDEIDMIRNQEHANIVDFEARQRQMQPWQYRND